MNEMKTEGAAALLNSTVQLRSDLIRAMNSQITAVAVPLLCIWAFYFILFALDDFSNRSAGLSAEQRTILLILTAITSLVLGLWRIRAKYLDNKIAGLYAEMYLYETILSAPTGMGTAGYLRAAVPKLRPLLDEERLTPEMKAEAIASLARSRRLGERGQLKVTLWVLALMNLLLAIGLLCMHIRYPLSWLLMGVHGLALLCLYIAGTRFQREPRGEVWEAVERLRHSKEGTD